MREPPHRCNIEEEIGLIMFAGLNALPKITGATAFCVFCTANNEPAKENRLHGYQRPEL